MKVIVKFTSNLALEPIFIPSLLLSKTPPIYLPRPFIIHDSPSLIVPNHLNSMNHALANLTLPALRSFETI
jgi:hypothetical protein